MRAKPSHFESGNDFLGWIPRTQTGHKLETPHPIQAKERLYVRGRHPESEKSAHDTGKKNTCKSYIL
jgi:hypothetical protein